MLFTFKRVGSIGRACATSLVIALASLIATPAVAGNVEDGKKKATACAACHGPDGNSMAPNFPKIAGQHEKYLLDQLKAFKAGTRKDPIMSAEAAKLSAKEMEDLAAYYASQPVTKGVASSKELAKQGERIYRGGNAKMGVSACMSCHGPSGHGIPPRFPRVSSQHAEYTKKQLLAFRADTRPSDAEIMTRIAQRMTEAEIRAVSEYMAGLN